VRTIVVASDAPSVRADVVAVVGDPETDIVEVDTGQAVAPAVDEHEPDLVIVAHVPVLMLLDRRPDVFLAKRSDAEGWIVKPLDPIRLRKATTALIDGGIFHDESFQPVPVLAVVSGAQTGSDAAGSST
jgi:hypothetical protein